MFTVRMRMPWTGTFAPNLSETPSSGWMRRTRAFGSRPSDASREKTWCGATRNWIAISVDRLGSRDRDPVPGRPARSEEHTSELQSQFHLVCRLLVEKINRYICTAGHHSDYLRSA